MEVQARKFYAQRNMYLCGMTLFLSLILNRTYVQILENMRLEAKVRMYESGNVSDKDAEKLAKADEAGPAEVGRLRNKLAQKDRDMETLKKQVDGLQREYGILGDQVAGNKDQTPKKDR
jgi:B-cell receptor-associated protein 31